MNRLTIAPYACLALAACNQQPSVSLTNASPEEVAAAAKSSGLTMAAFKPGQWETRSELLEMTFPGMKKMPKQYLDQMKSRMSARTSVTSCMTDADAKSPGRFFTSENRGKCRFEKYEASGGKLDATMVCGADRGEMRMHMAGTFSAEAFTLENEMTTSTPMGDSHTRSKVTGKRIGDCPAQS